MHKLFPSQMEGETIFQVVREHWFHLFLKLLVWVFFAGMLVWFNRFVAANLPQLQEGTWGQVTLLFTQIYTLFLTLSLFLIFAFYYLNVHIITSVRVVDIDQEGLFAHTVSELHIDKIEDVTSKVNGVFGTLFNYGDVFVQTAGTLERFKFEDVPNPAEIEKTILNLYEKNSNFAKEGVQNNS